MSRVLLFMNQYFEFIQRHWELSILFIGLILVYLFLEFRSKAMGLAEYNPQKTVLMLNHNEAVLIDLREETDFKMGHIANSINIPFSQMNNHLKTLNKNKNKTLILLTNKTSELLLAKKILVKEGFTQFGYLTGGIAAWEQEQLPIVKTE